MQQTETRIQMIKMLNEFKLTAVHFARPSPKQICACAWIYRWTKKTVENQDWATGPPGLRAVVGRGPLSAGLLLAKPLEMQTRAALYNMYLFGYFRGTLSLFRSHPSRGLQYYFPENFRCNLTYYETK